MSERCTLTDLAAVALLLAEGLGTVVAAHPPKGTEHFVRFEIDLINPERAAVCLGRLAAGDLEINLRRFLEADRQVRWLLRQAKGGQLSDGTPR